MMNAEQCDEPADNNQYFRMREQRQADANQAPGDDNGRQQEGENNVDINRKLFAVIAVSALSLLVAIATLILTITLSMPVKDRTEAASKVKGDF